MTLLILAVYGRVLENGFVNFDDDVYIYANPQIVNGLTPEGFRWAFTNVSYVYYQPITWISHMLDVSWFGMEPAGHHVVSVLLHAGTAAMILVWLFQTTGHLWRSASTAAIFAIHPLRVESVAWATERKDVLSAFFLLVSLLAYTHYVTRPSLRRYLLFSVALTLGLLSKPMLVSAPLLFLLADYWPLQRSEKFIHLVREKVPLLILAAIVGGITYSGQQQAGAMRALQHVPFVRRAGNAVLSYALYVGKTIWPHPLTVLYPYASTLPAWQTVAAALILGAITTAAVFCRRTHSYLLIGWLWFIVAMLPVIGLVQVGMQAYADRFSYVPSLLFLAALVWGAADFATRMKFSPQLVATVVAGLILTLSATTWIQIAYWHDSIALFEHAVKNTGPNPLAEQNLGVALAESNHNVEALAHLAAAVRLDPNIFQAQYNLGKAQASQKQVQAAIGSFSQAVKLRPEYAQAYYARAVMYESAGQPDRAAADLRRALKNGLPVLYQPEAYNNLGVLEAQAGKMGAAVANFQEAVRLRPNFPDAQVNLSTALVQTGRKKEAIAQLTEAIAVSPSAPSIREALARLQSP